MIGQGERPETYLGRKISTGSFAFDEATLRSLIKDWHELAESYYTSWTTATAMSEIEGPGTDFASQSHAKAANKSGASYLDYVQHNFQFCRDQARQFQNALDDYLDAEHSAVTDIDKSGPQGPHPKV